MYAGIKYNRELYGIIALLCLFLVMVASGGGLFGSGGHWMADWQHKAFWSLCHQDPSRSFWINGKPMAVCARCFGIYAGFTLSWLSIPFLGNLRPAFIKYSKKLLLCTILLNVVDVVGNVLGFWQNTSITRSVTGGFVGIAAVLIMADEFLTIKKETERDTYGFNRTI